MRTTVEGNHVYLNFEFTTGDASGQNMVTIATEAICTYIQAHSPVLPRYSFIEANLSGDKKASAQSFLSVRGRKVTAEVILPTNLIAHRLRTTPIQMVNYWRMSAIGGVLTGTLGVHGHYANGLAALYIACGRTPGLCRDLRWSRASRSPSRASSTPRDAPQPHAWNHRRCRTGLPLERACLEILGLVGPGRLLRWLRSVPACVRGELSIIEPVRW